MGNTEYTKNNGTFRGTFRGTGNVRSVAATIGDLKNLVPNQDDPSCKGKIQRFLANFVVMVCVATPIVTICYFAYKP